MRMALCVALALCLAPTTSWANVEGSYTLNKKRALSDMQKDIAKLPQRRRAFANMALAMVKSMAISFTLTKGGKATVSMKMKVFGRTKHKQGKGTWKQTKSGQIRIDTESRDRKGKLHKDTMLCKQEGKELACINGKKGKKRKKLYFQKSK